MRVRLDLRYEGEVLVTEVQKRGKGKAHKGLGHVECARDEHGYRWLLADDMVDSLVANGHPQNGASEQKTEVAQ